MSVQPCTLFIPGDYGKGCLLDTTTGRVFGPVFDDLEEADAFAWWSRTQEGMERDPRRFTPDELEHAFWKFRQSRKVRAAGSAVLGGADPGAGGPEADGSLPTSGPHHDSPVVGPGAEGVG